MITKWMQLTTWPCLTAADARHACRVARTADEAAAFNAPTKDEADAYTTRKYRVLHVRYSRPTCVWTVRGDVYVTEAWIPQRQSDRL